MKTHALAKNLRQLADWLDQLPNQELSGLNVHAGNEREKAASLALNVATLASLSRVDRREWMAFIEQHQFPIDIRPRDASRDVLGKLLKFLEEEPMAIDYLQRRARHDVGASPELSRALKALLSYRG